MCMRADHLFLSDRRCNTFSPSSSHVAAMGATGLQLSPQADHVLGGLIVCGDVTIEATGLVEPDVMPILYRPTSDVEFLHPHPHVHIFHLK